MRYFPEKIVYSDKFEDKTYYYRHTILSNEAYLKYKTKIKLLSENEWRALGVCMSKGWVHYAFHTPEPNILLFRKEKLEINILY